MLIKLSAAGHQANNQHKFYFAVQFSDIKNSQSFLSFPDIIFAF